MTSEEVQQLIEASEAGVRNAYTENASPADSRIGAAVLTSAGNVHSSGQYYSHTGSLTLHAEQAVLACAAAHGEYGIVAIAVTWNAAAGLDRDDTSIIYPCHMCKQLLWESHLRSGLNTEILIVKHSQVVERLFLNDIMSHTWPR